MKNIFIKNNIYLKILSYLKFDKFTETKVIFH